MFLSFPLSFFLRSSPHLLPRTSSFVARLVSLPGAVFVPDSVAFSAILPGALPRWIRGILATDVHYRAFSLRRGPRKRCAADEPAFAVPSSRGRAAHSAGN